MANDPGLRFPAEFSEHVLRLGAAQSLRCCCAQVLRLFARNVLNLFDARDLDHIKTGALKHTIWRWGSACSSIHSPAWGWDAVSWVASVKTVTC